MIQKMVLIGLLLFCGSSLFAEEIPNGDNDLIWEQDIYPRFVTDAKFHPITGNIIAAVNHEIWEIDVKDGHKIRVFEGGPATGPDDQFKSLQISADGKTIVTGMGSGIKGLIIWDYESGKIKNVFKKFEVISRNIGIFPDNKRVLFFSPKIDGMADSRFLLIIDIEKDSILITKSVYPNFIQMLALSANGQYIAICIWDSSEKKYKMELWDAETLTHIRDFGEAVNANEFWDVKISNDNQYIGFVSDKKFYVFWENGNLVNIIDQNAEPANICFTNDNSSILLGRVKNSEYYIDIINLQLNKITYSFHGIKPGMNTVFNKNNEIFAGQSGIKLFSNRWYTIDVKDNQIEFTFKINYLEKKLIIENSTNQILTSFEITDINGKILHSTNLNQSSQSTFEFEFKFIPGVYFATIHTANGKNYTQKFLVVE